MDYVVTVEIAGTVARCVHHDSRRDLTACDYARFRLEHGLHEDEVGNPAQLLLVAACDFDGIVGELGRLVDDED